MEKSYPQIEMQHADFAFFKKKKDRLADRNMDGNRQTDRDKETEIKIDKQKE